MSSVFDPEGAALPGSGIFGLPHRPDQARVILVPVPWDATTSYRPGTAQGPDAILKASAQVDLFDSQFGRPYEVGIALLDDTATVLGWNSEARALAEPIIAVGGVLDDRPDLRSNLGRVNDYGAKVNAWVAKHASRWLDAGRLVGVVGGDHSTPFGLIEEVAARNAGLGILHIDAHADLREAYEGFTWSHASIMHNVLERIPEVARIVQVGIRDFSEKEWNRAQRDPRVVSHPSAALASESFRGTSWVNQCERILRDLPNKVYVSFDIDGLDPTLCPNTGTPVPGGLSFEQVTCLLELLARSGRTVVGFDLNEVAPGSDSEWDANVGARVLYKLIGCALAHAGPPEN